MKRKVCLFLALAIVFLLSACGSGGEDKQSSASDQESTNVETSTVDTDYPSKQITIVVPYAAGGASDVMARIFALKLSEELDGATVVVENRQGGTGAVGIEYAYSQPSDGYTMLYLEGNATLIPHLGYTEVLPSEFVELVRTHLQPSLLVVRSDMAVESLDEFLDYAKSNPEVITIGTAGAGSGPHMTGIQLGNETGTSYTFVPFDGGKEAAAAAIGGNVDAVIAKASEIQSGVDSGDLKVLCSFSEERTAFYPDVPTSVELGVNVINVGWGGFAVKADCPQEIIDILAEASAAAAQSQDIQDLCEQRGYDYAFLAMDEAQAFVAEQYELNGDMVAALNEAS